MSELKTKATGTRDASVTVEDIYNHASLFNATQIRILDAARHCVKTLGMRKTSINDIARQAGVTRPTVYSYFSNKDDVVKIALLYSGYELGRKVLDRIATLDDFRERVLTACQFTIENLPNEPYLALIAEVDISEFLNERALGDLESQELLWCLNSRVFEGGGLREEDLHEVIEVCTRFVLSMILIKGTTHREGPELRAFLERRLLPSLIS